MINHTIRRIETEADILELVLQSRALLGVDVGIVHEGWLAHNWAGVPVAFAHVAIDDGNNVCLTGVGVMPNAQGSGLQVPLCQHVLDWARKRGADMCYTYTLPDNYPSMTNLIRAGFNFYNPPPSRQYVGPDVQYFIKEFKR